MTAAESQGINRGVLRWMINPARIESANYPDQAELALPSADMERARADLQSWPEYEPTPLHALPGLAASLGVAAIHLKDEGERKPLASFKALGGAYALSEALRDRVERATGTRPSSRAVWNGDHAIYARDLQVVAATDGNHGRSLAWGAQHLGVACTIYLPFNVSSERERLIADFGARIVRVPGNYDAAVAAAADAGAADGVELIQDTSYPGYLEPCRRIMAGYTLMAAEIREQWPPHAPPTHMFLQSGCGGMAAALAADFWINWQNPRPRVILVEALTAAGFLDSLEAGSPVVVEGDLDTLMIGIACGEVSLLAWDVLKTGAYAAIAIPDDIAVEAMRLLRGGTADDPPLRIGETGVAGLAGLMAAMADPACRDAMRLDSDSRILLIGSEGPIDLPTYEKLTASTYAAGQAK
jgi:diaminopropionate ammonia-lyase